MSDSNYEMQLEGIIARLESEVEENKRFIKEAADGLEKLKNKYSLSPFALLDIDELLNKAKARLQGD